MSKVSKPAEAQCIYCRIHTSKPTITTASSTRWCAYKITIRYETLRINNKTQLNNT